VQNCVWLKKELKMNLHTTSIDRKTTINRKRTGSRRKEAGSFAVVFRIVAFLIAVFIIASTRALLNSETEKLNRRAVKLKTEIHSFNREIADLQIRREQFHGRYILKQIKNFDLKLQYPRAGQVRRIRVSTKTPYREMKRTEVSEMLLSQR